MRNFPGLLAAAVLAGAVAPAAADSITRIEIRGLSPEQEANVRRRLSLETQLGRELGEQRLDYLLLESEREARQALEPYGYFSPEIRITPPEGASGPLLIEVQPGEPVRVRRSSIVVAGPGNEDVVLAAGDGTQAEEEGHVEEGEEERPFRRSRRRRSWRGGSHGSCPGGSHRSCPGGAGSHGWILPRGRPNPPLDRTPGMS